MVGTLYRYSHPHDYTRFIYVGQGLNRDKYHRSGRSSFGRRFKKLFPNMDLPQPIREQVEVSSQSELNEEETIWMFKFHTWCGYPDGMNLQFPGSSDYKNMGALGGRALVASGQWEKIRNLPQSKEACRAASKKRGLELVESGEWKRILNLPQTMEARKRNG